MGCFMSLLWKRDRIQVPPPPPSAFVISLNGALRQYRVPVTALQVLRSEPETSDGSAFLCSSDRLYYDEYIPSLCAEEQLHADQIYFVIPASKLRQRLSASDMASMAHKASIALQHADDSHRRKKARICPALLPNQSGSSDPEHDSIVESSIYVCSSDVVEDETASLKTVGKAPQPQQQGSRLSRSASVKRLHRYTSKRAELAVRSFRLRLCTIYEGTILQV